MGAPDWTRDCDYRYTQSLSPQEWAWEFLRRNPDFRIAWNAAQIEYGISGYSGHITTLVCALERPSLSAWGCLYSSDPQCDAREARVFWLPDLCPGVLRLLASQLSERIDVTPFRLRDIDSPSVLLELPSGPQHLLFAEGGRTLQLVVDGADVMTPVRLLFDGAPERAGASAQLRALRCFNDLRLAGRLYPSRIQREPLSLYRRTVLRALDAEAAGASQRDMARYVFAGAYTDETWLSPDRPLREKIRRALRRGHALMHRGYRRLLG